MGCDANDSYISLYGIDALRDSVTLVYGALAFIVIALFLQDARRLNRLVVLYARFAVVFPPFMTVFAIISLAGQDILPQFPGTGLPILTIRPGDMGVHLAGCAVFVLLGLCRPGYLWGAFLMMAMAIVATQNRGAVLAMMLPTFLAVIVSGKVRSLLRPALAIMLCVALAYAADASLPNERPRPGPGSQRPPARQ